MHLSCASDRPSGLDEAPAPFGAHPTGANRLDHGAEPSLHDYAAAGPTWLWQTDPELRLTYVTDQFSAQTGIARTALLGRTLAEIIGEGLAPDERAAYLADLAAQRAFQDVRHRLSDPATGAERHVQISGRPFFDHAGGLLGYRGTGADISVQVQATRDAARAESRLRDGIESLRDGFALFDEHDRLVICNRQYREIDGLAAATITDGTSWEAMLRAGVSLDHYVAARGRAEDYVAERLEHHLRADGTVREEQLSDGRWIQIRVYPTSDGGRVCTRTNITELKQRERTQAALSDELRTQYLRFDAALNNMIQGLCMFDAEQRLIVCNARYLEMYGFSPDVVKPGIKLREIMEYSVSLGNYRRKDAGRAITERPTTADKREQAVLHQRLNDGRVIAVMHQPMPGGGSVATYEDVSETVHAQEALRDYASKLERSNRELQDFASIASHDLQEPLRKIEAFGDRLVARCGDDLSDIGHVYVERMQDAAGRMRCLINDLLTYSRVTTKARPFAPVDLGRIASEVISDLQIAIEQADARIELGDLPTIEADATQMRQLFQNLLSNALKFRHEERRHEVRIEARLYTPARPEHRAAGRHLCEITVADNGIGFKQDYAERIFGIFQRLHGRGDYPGTGIGLATCRKILERHGGTITAQGRPGEGATFVCTLPVKHAKRGRP